MAQYFYSLQNIFTNQLKTTNSSSSLRGGRLCQEHKTAAKLQDNVGERVFPENPVWLVSVHKFRDVMTRIRENLTSLMKWFIDQDRTAADRRLLPPSRRRPPLDVSLDASYFALYSPPALVFLYPLNITESKRRFFVCFGF